MPFFSGECIWSWVLWSLVLPGIKWDVFPVIWFSAIHPHKWIFLILSLRSFHATHSLWHGVHKLVYKRFIPFSLLQNAQDLRGVISNISTLTNTDISSATVYLESLQTGFKKNKTTSLWWFSHFYCFTSHTLNILFYCIIPSLSQYTLMT